MKNLDTLWYLLVVVLATPTSFEKLPEQSGNKVQATREALTEVKIYNISKLGSLKAEHNIRNIRNVGSNLHFKDMSNKRPHYHGDITKSTTSFLTIRQRRAANDWLIAPNTRWCGRGNTANNTYNHLGGASAADRCCRKHDHCHAFIPAMSNRYSHFNYRPYTLTHCSCDRRFRTCLKMAGDLHANTIGQMFFNIMRSQCFILRRERLCRLRAADGSCSLYHIKQRAYVKDNKRY